MNVEEKGARIYIIGAGVSGLIAAKNLEDKGYNPVILEASDRIGGRVVTDIIDGYQLDRGFQVLLEAYPMAQKYLNYDTLELQSLIPGAMIFSEGSSTIFGDPLRDSSLLFSTLFSSVASTADKWKIFQLKKKLENSSLKELFDEEEQTTHEYLKAFGFSDGVIQNFFRPFFSGIFLEPDLATSSRMFTYVYKLFGEGGALIPKAGIGAIPDQLERNLNRTTIRLKTPVEKVQNESIVLKNGEVLDSDFTIIATDPSEMLPNYVSSLNWKSCDNLYFTVKDRTTAKPIIGLNSRKGSLINNIFFPTSIDAEVRGTDELLSVTVVRSHNHTKEALIAKVHIELQKDFGISQAKFLHHYHITSALPQLNNLQYEVDDTESLITDKVAIAGDHNLNGSLNAAMISGESAARIADRALADSLLTFG
ncbi:NAD(P)/FAD-dependent oxidoreductase [Ekhidna sp.]|uniref:NAD(P)/FAD-dependent oxidoreductase n=1 Tax=Ekhidna sp. TaxID=2608089 RepID=UPI003CCC1E33